MNDSDHRCCVTSITRAKWFFSPALLLVFSGLLHGQGALAPAAAPAPSQKSLQEIWDAAAAMDNELNALRAENMQLRSMIKSQAIGLAAIPWEKMPLENTLATRELRIVHVSRTTSGLPVIFTRFKIVGTDEESRIRVFRRTLAMGWTMETLPDPSASTTNPYVVDFQVGPSGELGIAIIRGGGELYGYQWNGSSWQGGLVDANANLWATAGEASINYNSSGNFEIAYAKIDVQEDEDTPPVEERGVLRYGVFDGSNWVTSNITGLARAPNSVDLITNHQNRQSVAYTDRLNRSVLVAEWSGSSWSNTLDRIIADPPVSTLTGDKFYRVRQIALPDGRIMIVFGGEGESGADQLFSLQKTIEGWDTEPQLISGLRWVGVVPSLILDSHHRPFVSYGNDGVNLGQIDFLLYAQFSNNRWISGTVDLRNNGSDPTFSTGLYHDGSVLDKDNQVMIVGRWRTGPAELTDGVYLYKPMLEENP